MKRLRIPRRGLIAACGVLLLAGCGVLPEKSEIALYAPVLAPATQTADWPSVRSQLVILRPTADGLLEGARIVVRPTPGEVQVYRGALWATHVPDLLQDAVLRRLEDSGRITGVGRRGSGVAGDFDLLLDIRRFDADYAGNPTPTVQVEVVAKLVHGKQNAVVATQVFRAQAQPPGSAIAEVARAFDQPLSTVSSAIAGWTLQQMAQHERR